ncbi:MAG: 4Fe-4S dicluster domain-containing protein [Candidatus Binatia bacterium]
MARWGMVIDQDRCTGCGACAAACQAENNIPVVSREQAQQGRSMNWLRMVHEVEGAFPNANIQTYPRLCQQCDNPPCTYVCPVHATYRAEDGIVAQIFPQCIGCRYCMAACPYTVKTFNWFAPRWSKEQRRSRNPDVSLRPKGVVEKCTFCSHRLQKAKDAARARGTRLEESDYQPACVQACPAEAMFFGNLDDPKSIVNQLAGDRRAQLLLEELGTAPKVIYLRSRGPHEG